MWEINHDLHVISYNHNIKKLKKTKLPNIQNCYQINYVYNDLWIPMVSIENLKQWRLGNLVKNSWENFFIRYLL